MTDPVDTEALREQQWQNVDELVEWATAAADEVDRLRAAITLYKLANVQLRAVIENAPHDTATCLSWFGPQDAQCTCWKADAL